MVRARSVHYFSLQRHCSVPGLCFGRTLRSGLCQDATFPRRDDENVLLIFSDSVRFWQTPELLLPPARPREFFKIGDWRCQAAALNGDTGCAGLCSTAALVKFTNTLDSSQLIRSTVRVGISTSLPENRCPVLMTS